MSTDVTVFQSPLIGAFVPGNTMEDKVELDIFVSIPSDRGIRSGDFGGVERIYYTCVSIPSDRGIRSGHNTKREEVPLQ